jgi:hypothetical protein
MTPKEVTALLTQIQEHKDLINQDLSLWDPATRPGKTGAQQEAKLNLPALENQYLYYLQEAALVMILRGDDVSQKGFAEIAAQEGNTITLDAGALYRKLSEGVEESLGYSREFGVTQISQVVDSIRDICLEIGIRETDRPRHMEQVVVLRQADIEAHVRKIVRASDNGFLNNMFMSRELLTQALAKRYTQAVVPVVIVGAEEEEIEALKQLSVKTQAIVKVPLFFQTEDLKKFVLEIFNNVKKSSKQKKQEAPTPTT